MKTVRTWIICFNYTKTFLRNSEIHTATSSQTSCKFEFDICILRGIIPPKLNSIVLELTGSKAHWYSDSSPHHTNGFYVFIGS